MIFVTQLPLLLTGTSVLVIDLSGILSLFSVKDAIFWQIETYVLFPENSQFNFFLFFCLFRIGAVYEVRNGLQTIEWVSSLPGKPPYIFFFIQKRKLLTLRQSGSIRKKSWYSILLNVTNGSNKKNLFVYIYFSRVLGREKLILKILMP